VNLEIDSKDQIIKGYVLNPPSLGVGGKSLIPQGGNFRLRDPVFKPALFNNWVLIYSCENERVFYIIFYTYI
jgi:hypothetical protein